MARRTPVPRSEKEIGERLRRFREESLISQMAFALKAGLTREQLAKYEFGRVPLPWIAGDAICRTYNINQRWLVTGLAPKLPYLDPSLAAEQIRPRMLFSDAYFLHLLPEIRASLEGAALDLGIPAEKLDEKPEHQAALLGWHHGELFNRDTRVEFVKAYLTIINEALPIDQRVKFLRTIERAIDRFGKIHGSKLSGFNAAVAVVKAFQRINCKSNEASDTSSLRSKKHDC